MSEHFFDPEAWAPLARALEAYSLGDRRAVLIVHSDVGEPETMEVGLFFRAREELRDADRAALRRVRGRVLDVGAGVGCMSLILQDEGFRVTAVEMIPEAVEIMRARGVEDIWEGSVEEMDPSGRFDTLLLLMNGTAIAGTLAGLPRLLGTLDRLLAPGGQILLDSTDLRPRRAPVGQEVGWGPPQQWVAGEYPGELQYQLEFCGMKGTPFPQLFLDPDSLETLASEEGWRTEIVWAEAEGGYLACLERGGE